MPNTKVSILVTVAVVVSVFGLALTILPDNVGATTLYVGGSGPGNYTTIQGAIDAASPGNSIYVYGGTYYESINVHKTLSIIGENRDLTRIEGSGSGVNVEVTANGVSITAFTITNRSGAGIYLRYVQNSHVDNNIISSLDSGMGILNHYSRNTTITNNVFLGEGILIEGGLLEHWISHSIDTSNTVNGKPVYYWRNAIGGSVPPGAGQVILVNCTNMIVENQNVSGGDAGLSLAFSSSNTIANNTADGNDIFAMSLFSSNDNLIINNTAQDTGSRWSNAYGGVYMYNSHNNTLSNNNVSYSTGRGIFVEYSNNTAIVNNDLFDTQRGIQIYYSHNNTILNNDMSFAGIDLAGSDYNTVRGNVMVNSYGMGASSSQFNRFENNEILQGSDGVWLSSSKFNLVANNTVSDSLRYGMEFDRSENNTIANNIISNSAEEGIYLRFSSNITLTNNTMVRNGIFIWTRELEEWNTHSIDVTNTVNGKPVRYWKNINGGTVPSGAGQVILANCTNVVVENQNVSDGTVGIQVGLSSKNIIANNTASSNYWYGIYVLYSNNHTITNNTASMNTYQGITVESSIFNTVFNNTATLNVEHGICLWESQYTTVFNNTATSNIESGIYLRKSGFNTVFNNSVAHNSEGINIAWRSNDNTINSNNASYNEIGILSDFESNTIADNLISLNTRYGILLSGTKYNVLTRNVMTGDGIAILGTDVEYWNNHKIDTSNTVNGKPVQYWKNASGGTIPSGAGQVILGNCTGVIVENQDASNVSKGILLGYSSFNTLRNNTASYNTEDGIYILHSNFNTLINNTLSHSRHGVFFRTSRGNTMVNNTMVGDGIYIYGGLSDWIQTIDSTNTVNGKPVIYWRDTIGSIVPLGAGQVILVSCSNVIADGQDVSNGTTGIALGYSTGNTVSNVTSLSNTEEGIFLWNSNDNVITDNVVSSNEDGIYVEDSDYNLLTRNTVSSNSVGISLVSARDTKVFHNNIINNTLQAFHASMQIAPWDNGYPSGGNYWSDYTGVDICTGPGQNVCPFSDGLGDTPYLFDWSRDRYPLMTPFVAVRPQPPTLLDATLTGSNLENVTITWALSPDDGGGSNSVMGYRIYRSSIHDSNGTNYPPIVDFPNGTSEFTDTLAGEGNPNNYFYRVCALDAASISSCATDQAGKFTRPLSMGRNIIAIPLVQSDKGIEAVLQTVEWEKAWRYNSALKDCESYSKDKPWVGELQSTDRRMGIWAEVTAESNLTVAGIVPSTTAIDLWEGWNLVGFPSFKGTYTVGDLKASLPVLGIEGFDANTSPYFLRPLQDSDILQAGQGYWIEVKTNLNWVLP